jgi:Flp pilus assembly pilin Flp
MPVPTCRRSIWAVAAPWNFLAANTGVTAIEYALVAAAMGLSTALGAHLLHPSLSSSFQNIAYTLDAGPAVILEEPSEQ